MSFVRPRELVVLIRDMFSSNWEREKGRGVGCMWLEGKTT